MDTLNETKKEPQSIGGWLILVLIGLAITPFRTLIIVIKDILPVIDSEIISNNPALKGMIYSELIINLIFVVFSILLFILMLKKLKIFPSLIIVYFLSNLFFVVLDMIAGSQIPIIREQGLNKSSIIELSRAIIGSAIWVPYFIYSKRVKNTFFISNSLSNNLPSNSKSTDTLIIIFLIYLFISSVIGFAMQNFVDNWYEGGAKYLQIGMNIIYALTPILLGIAIRHKTLRIIGVILASCFSLYIIYSNIAWMFR
jgi:hypothetical protein